MKVPNAILITHHTCSNNRQGRSSGSCHVIYKTNRITWFDAPQLFVLQLHRALAYPPQLIPYGGPQPRSGNFAALKSPAVLHAEAVSLHPSDAHTLLKLQFASSRSCWPSQRLIEPLAVCIVAVWTTLRLLQLSPGLSA